MSKIVFGYKIVPVWRGGHYFTVYEDGIVKYKKFVYGLGTTESKEISIPKTVVEDLQKCLTDKKSLIDKLPKQIDSWLIDGACHYFNFMGRQISGWNIMRPSEEYYKRLEECAEKLPRNMPEIIQQQHYVLEIFESIYDVLKDYGLKVETSHFLDCDWEM